jgi:hypothetical protein
MSAAASNTVYEMAAEFGLSKAEYDRVVLRPNS